MKFFGFFSFLRVFRLAGFFVFAAGISVFIRGLAWRDPYEIVLAGAALCVWCALFFVGLFGARRRGHLAPGWFSPVPLAAGGGEPHTITGLGEKTPWFFRLHFVLKGRFLPAAGKAYRVSAEVTGAGEPAAPLEINFPLSGVFHGEGAARLCDVFGFFAFPCGAVSRRSLSVQPAPFRKKPVLRIDPFSGAEDRQSRSQNDEERYYMREYAPGDRFRDINWKTSERLATLITRISPHTQEKTHLVHIAFRNYGPALASPLVCVWLLDRTKARLARFLRTLKEEHPDFIFHITSAQSEKEIASEEELTAFLDELAVMDFRPPASEKPIDVTGAGSRGELYIFSTACDTGLPALIASRGEAPSYVYTVFPAKPPRTAGGKKRGGLNEKSAQRAREKAEVFHWGRLFAEGFLPVSGLIPRRGIAMLAAAPSPRKGSLETTYAEVRL